MQTGSMANSGLDPVQIRETSTINTLDALMRESHSATLQKTLDQLMTARDPSSVRPGRVKCQYSNLKNYYKRPQDT